MSGKDKLFWWCVAVFVGAAMAGGGFEATDTEGNNNPKPQQSAVCNEYFKGGC